MQLIVTLYDLIPEIFPERYLADPGLRRRYRARLELVRAADMVLAISETTARDASDLLHIPAKRIEVVGAAAGASYARPAATARSAGRHTRRGTRARGPVRALHRGNGRPEELPGSVPARGRGCRNRYATRGSSSWCAAWTIRRATTSSISARSWHRIATAPARLRSRRGVAPALPVDGAVRVPVALRGIRPADRGSARVRRAHDRFEHVVGGRAARARSPVRPGRRRRDGRRDRTRAHRRRAARAKLDEQARMPLPGWDAVADRVAAVYERLLAGPRPPARRRPLVAVVTPLPPAASGVADYSYRLLEALREHCEVHTFADGRRFVDPELGPPARARWRRGVAGAAPPRTGTGPRWVRLCRVLPR